MMEDFEKELEALARDVDDVMIRTMALGVSGDTVLAIVHAHALGRMAAVFGGAAAAAHARGAADRIEELQALPSQGKHLSTLATLKPAGRA